jgi:hypothetical protein
MNTLIDSQCTPVTVATERPGETPANTVDNGNVGNGEAPAPSAPGSRQLAVESAGEKGDTESVRSTEPYTVQIVQVCEDCRFPIEVRVGRARVRVYEWRDKRGRGMIYGIVYYSAGKRTQTNRRVKEDAIHAAKRLAAFLNDNPDAKISKMGALTLKPSLASWHREVPTELLRVCPGIAPLAFPRGACVYFLILSGAVVYVGKTLKMATRLGKHLEDKEFDSICYVSVMESEIDITEQAYIRHFKPMYNKITYKEAM